MVVIVKDKEVNITNNTSMKITTTLDSKFMSYRFMRVTTWMQTFAVKVIIKMPKAAMFVKMVLSSKDPNDGMKLPIISDIKTMMLSFTSSLVLDDTEVLRFSDIFIATDNSDKEATLILKILNGSQNLL